MRFDSVLVPMRRERFPTLLAAHASHTAPVTVVYQGDDDPSGALLASLLAANDKSEPRHGIHPADPGMGNVFDASFRKFRNEGIPCGTILWLEDDAVVPGALWEWLLSDRPVGEPRWGILPRRTFNRDGRPDEDPEYQHFSGLLIPVAALGALRRTPLPSGPEFDAVALDALDDALDEFARLDAPPLMHPTTADVGSAFEDHYERMGGNQLWSTDTPATYEPPSSPNDRD
jgi:hypothetical protein